MYINFELVKEKGLLPLDVVILQALHQKEGHVFSDTDFLNDFSEKGYIEHVKAKNKSQTFYDTARLSSKGREVLESLQIPEITEGDLDMRDYLCAMYLNNEDEERTIGNKKLVGIYCTEFRKHLGLSLHQMYWLCFYFLQEFKFTKVLENIFFDKNKNRYGKFRDNIDDSKLYQFYDSHKAQVEEFWKLKIKEDGI